MKNNEIKIVNRKQVYLYMKNGCFPIRLEVGKETNLLKNPIVYVFEKNETLNKLYTKWLNKTLG